MASRPPEASTATAPAAGQSAPPKPLPKDPPPPGFGIPEKRGSTSDDRD